MDRIRKILLDAAYTASTHQNVRQIYDLCNKNLHLDNPKRGNEQDQKNVSNTITDEDGFLTVVVYVHTVSYTSSDESNS